MRRAALLVTWAVALASGLAVVLGLLTVLLLGFGLEPEGDECNCGDTGRRRADVVLEGQVSARDGDELLITVDEVERGRVPRRVVVRSYGVSLRPWREYQLWLFRDDDRLNLSHEVPPESLGFAAPEGLRSFGAVPLTARLGVVALPALAASVCALVWSRGWDLLRDRD